MDDQRDQARRKVKAAVVQLRFLGERYITVFHRRSQDQQRYRERNGLYRPINIKGESVRWPWTPFERGGSVSVLKGDFERAIKLVQRIKEAQLAYPMPDIMNVSVVEGVTWSPLTVQLGDLLRAKLGLA